MDGLAANRTAGRRRSEASYAHGNGNRWIPRNSGIQRD
jgi:hypothetical protein